MPNEGNNYGRELILRSHVTSGPDEETTKTLRL